MQHEQKAPAIMADSRGLNKGSLCLAEPDEGILGKSSNTFQMALSYVGKGWSIVLIPFREKAPKGNGWQNNGITTREDVERLFDSGPMNVGVILGPTSNGLTDIDLDCPEAIKLAPSFLPATEAIFGRASAKSAHRLYYTDLGGKAEKGAERFQDPDMPQGYTTIIELRTGSKAKGVQTVFPGSTHKDTGEAITWEQAGDPAQVEGSALQQRVKIVAAATILLRCWNSQGRHDFSLLVGAFLGRCKGWTEDHVEGFVEAIARAAGDDEIEDRLKAALDGFRASSNNERAWGLPALQDAIGEKRAKKVAAWLGYATGAVVTDLQSVDGGEEVVEEFNSKWAVILSRKGTHIMRFVEEQIGDGAMRRAIEYKTASDLRTWYANRTVLVGSRPICVADFWLKHPQRKQYEGLIFDPNGGEIINGKLNLWRGFGVEPKQGDWSLTRSHIKEVLANGDDASAEYIIKWLAWAVQNPSRHCETAIVFRGQKGTGKGLLGKTLVRIFGQHSIHISDQKHLVGNFNAHMEDTIFMFVDEGFWGGDIRHDGALKRLITEPTLFIEPKGVDAYMAPNRLKVLMASNERWVVPATEDERRYAVFDVSNARKKDTPYFKAIFGELDNGGIEAMLFDLLAMDLTDWHPREIVATEGLKRQQIEGLKPMDRWWLAMLEDGVIPAADPSTPHQAVSEPHEAVTSYGQKFPRPGLLGHLRASSQRIKDVSAKALGEYLSERGCERVKRVQPQGRRGWQFPPLNEARKEWADRFGGWTWPNPEQEDWEPAEAGEPRPF